MKEILAVVVTYNRCKMLEETIERLLSQKNKSFDILIVNNNSNDETNLYLKRLEEKNIEIMNLPRNLGGAGGFNKGLCYACEKGYKYAWIMDDDCFVEKNTLEELINTDKKLFGNYGWLSSRVVWKDGNDCLMNLQRKTPYKVIDGFNEEIIECVMSTFVSFFVKTSVVCEVGLPIKDFFIWADDLEFSRRISRKYKCYAVKNSVVTHHMKSNIGSSIADDDISRIDRYNYAYRNENYLYRNESLIGIIYYFAKSIYNSIKVILRHKPPVMKRLLIIYKNMIEGIFFNPTIEYVERKKNYEKNKYVD